MEKLSRIGFSCTKDNITLSTDSVIKFLRKNNVKKVCVLGTAALVETLEDSGFKISEEDAEYVVVGYDTELTYKKLIITSKLINKNIDYIATCELYSC